MFNLDGTGAPVFYNLKPEDRELLDLFQTKTVFTIGTHDTVSIYQTQIIRQAATHSWLMHILLAFASMHKRELEGRPIASTDEEFHWYQGAALFRDVLSRPVADEDRDALWATAALLGAASFYRIDATTPEEAWPLNPKQDLRWLGLSDGKKAVWKIAQIHRPESAFKDLQQHSNMGVEFDWTLLPPHFEKAGIDKMPYRNAAAAIANLLEHECNHGTVIRFLAFISQVQPEYRQLLDAKDPRAMLILAYWYAKVCNYNQWWINRRANLELRGICIYLERYHSQDEELMKLLEYPKMMIGLIQRRDEVIVEMERPAHRPSPVPEPIPPLIAFDGQQSSKRPAGPCSASEPWLHLRTGRSAHMAE